MPIISVHFWQLCIYGTSARTASEKRCAGGNALFSAEILTLDKGCAVHAFLLRGIALVGVNVHLIQRAEMLRAEIVHTLLDGTAYTRILAVFHNGAPFRAAAYAAA